VGVRPDGTAPAGVAAQAAVILDAIDRALAEAGLARPHLLRLATFLVDPADRPAYMAVRDAWVPDPPPASTLVVVKALARPDLVVEIEALAAG
jgi:enamine deaminase RidA (YjgF/YER057c/UK114 family)